jgi:hypothetical protein
MQDDARRLRKWGFGIAVAFLVFYVLVMGLSGMGGSSSVHTMAEIDACAGKTPAELRAKFGAPTQVDYAKDSYQLLVGEMKWIWRGVSVRDEASGVTSTQIVHADVSPSAGQTWSCGIGLSGR